MNGINKAFFEACEKGYLEKVKHLINIGAEINVLDKHGRTVLFFAYKNKKQIIINYLKEIGINTEIKDVLGQTAIIFAENNIT